MSIFEAFKTNKCLFNDTHLYYWANERRANYAVVRIKNLALGSPVFLNDKPWPVSSIGQCLLPLAGSKRLKWLGNNHQYYCYDITHKNIKASPCLMEITDNQPTNVVRPKLLPILNQMDQDLSGWGVSNASSVVSNKCFDVQNIHQKEVVILVHGLGRTKHSMAALAKLLQKQGKATCLVHYPSKSYPIEMLSDWLLSAVQQVSNDGFETIHIVTHSMGAILTRYALNLEPSLAQKIAKIVMLAPPNHGSEVIDRLGEYAWFKAIQGPAALQLFSRNQGLPSVIPPLNEALNKHSLIVVGENSSDPWFNRFFVNASGERIMHDGKVSVQSARMSNIQLKQVQAGHTLIMNHPDTCRLIINFLAHH